MTTPEQIPLRYLFLCCEEDSCISIILLSPAFLVGLMFCMSVCLLPKHIKNKSWYLDFFSQQGPFGLLEELIYFWSRLKSRWLTYCNKFVAPTFFSISVLDLGVAFKFVALVHCGNQLVILLF